MRPKPDICKNWSQQRNELDLPADQRRAILAVWDFCRAVDDAVDEAPSLDGLPSVLLPLERGTARPAAGAGARPLGDAAPVQVLAVQAPPTYSTGAAAWR